MKKSFLLLCVVLCTFIAQAQQAYIYLEPIKGMPCKVILNQKEVTFMTKNYFLVTLDKEGEQNLEIVFGNNTYPKQSFVVDAIKGGAYGFKLAKTAEDKFYLLDMVNNGKIIEPNTAVNIGLTTDDNIVHFFDPTTTANVIVQNDDKRKPKNRKQNQTAKEMNALQSELSKAKKVYGIVEVITSNTNDAEPKTSITTSPENIKTKAKESAVSKCSTFSTETEVNTFVEKLDQKNDDESKLILVKKRSFTGCLKSSQVYAIAQSFNTQYGRFSAVKFLKYQMDETENLIVLESLFKTENYKSKLREL
jgi:hypothetical protein